MGTINFAGWRYAYPAYDIYRSASAASRLG